MAGSPSSRGTAYLRLAFVAQECSWQARLTVTQWIPCLGPIVVPEE